MVVMGIFNRLLAANRIDVDLASEDRLKKRNTKARPMAQGRVSGLCAIGVLACACKGAYPKPSWGLRQEVRPSGTHARKHSDTDEHWPVPPELGR
jgi:hypothetical protein